MSFKHTAKKIISGVLVFTFVFSNSVSYSVPSDLSFALAHEKPSFVATESARMVSTIRAELRKFADTYGGPQIERATLTQREETAPLPNSLTGSQIQKAELRKHKIESVEQIPQAVTEIIQASHNIFNHDTNLLRNILSDVLHRLLEGSFRTEFGTFNTFTHWEVIKGKGLQLDVHLVDGGQDSLQFSIFVLPIPKHDALYEQFGNFRDGGIALVYSGPTEELEHTVTDEVWLGLDVRMHFEQIGTPISLLPGQSLWDVVPNAATAVLFHAVTHRAELRVDELTAVATAAHPTSSATQSLTVGDVRLALETLVQNRVRFTLKWFTVPMVQEILGEKTGKTLTADLLRQGIESFNAVSESYQIQNPRSGDVAYTIVSRSELRDLGTVAIAGAVAIVGWLLAKQMIRRARENRLFFEAKGEDPAYGRELGQFVAFIKRFKNSDEILETVDRLHSATIRRLVEKIVTASSDFSFRDQGKRALKNIVGIEKVIEQIQRDPTGRFDVAIQENHYEVAATDLNIMSYEFVVTPRSELRNFSAESIQFDSFNIGGKSKAKARSQAEEFMPYLVTDFLNDSNQRVGGTSTGLIRFDGIDDHPQFLYELTFDPAKLSKSRFDVSFKLTRDSGLLAASGSVTVRRAELRKLASVNPTQTKAWKDLAVYFHLYFKKAHLRDLFAKDPERAARFSANFRDGDVNFLVDYSKNRIDQKVFDLLLQIAKSTKLPDAIKRMFSGDKINETEGRAVLHTALRLPRGKELMVDGEDIVPKVYEVLDKMERFVNAVNSGDWRGSTDKKITDIVNIGIGGSDLGPYMTTEALEAFKTGKVNVHFVSNVDGSDITRKVLEKLNPETTLFIVASKTFTTQETMQNAETAKKWLLEKLGSFAQEMTVRKHFIAVSTNREAVEKFGIDPENMFEFWDWVGGRFSLWSAVGLSIATYIGFDNFKELLAGAHAMDEHFRTTPFDRNIPVILALLSIWYTNFFKAEAHAVLPYGQNLHRLPAYLQQAFMESNGKGTNRKGQKISYIGSPIIFGEAGTNGQHAFYQLIHQGTQLIPADFIAFANSVNPLPGHHEKLFANVVGQTEALAFGKTLQQVFAEGGSILHHSETDLIAAPRKVFDGNNPSTAILINDLTPRSLGALIAMYEHQIFVEGVILNIFSFDQWGVELGKKNAGKVLKFLMESGLISVGDSSTRQIIEWFRTNHRRSELRSTGQDELDQAQAALTHAVRKLVSLQEIIAPEAERKQAQQEFETATARFRALQDAQRAELRSDLQKLAWHIPGLSAHSNQMTIAANNDTVTVTIDPIRAREVDAVETGLSALIAKLEMEFKAAPIAVEDSSIAQGNKKIILTLTLLEKKPLRKTDEPRAELRQIRSGFGTAQHLPAPAKSELRTEQIAQGMELLQDAKKRLIQIESENAVRGLRPSSKLQDRQVIAINQVLSVIDFLIVRFEKGYMKQGDQERFIELLVEAQSILRNINPDNLTEDSKTHLSLALDHLGRVKSLLDVRPELRNLEITNLPKSEALLSPRSEAERAELRRSVDGFRNAVNQPTFASSAESRSWIAGKPTRTASFKYNTSVLSNESPLLTSAISSRSGTTTSKTASSFPSRFSTSVATSRAVNESFSKLSPPFQTNRIQQGSTLTNESQFVNINFRHKKYSVNTNRAELRSIEVTVQTRSDKQPQMIKLDSKQVKTVRQALEVLSIPIDAVAEMFLNGQHISTKHNLDNGLSGSSKLVIHLTRDIKFGLPVIDDFTADLRPENHRSELHLPINNQLNPQLRGAAQSLRTTGVASRAELRAGQSKKAQAINRSERARKRDLIAERLFRSLLKSLELNYEDLMFLYKLANQRSFDYSSQWMKWTEQNKRVRELKPRISLHASELFLEAFNILDSDGVHHINLAQQAAILGKIVAKLKLAAKKQTRARVPRPQRTRFLADEMQAEMGEGAPWSDRAGIDGNYSDYNRAELRASYDITTKPTPLLFINQSAYVPGITAGGLTANDLAQQISFAIFEYLATGVNPQTFALGKPHFIVRFSETKDSTPDIRKFSLEVNTSGLRVTQADVTATKKSDEGAVPETLAGTIESPIVPHTDIARAEQAATAPAVEVALNGAGRIGVKWIMALLERSDHNIHLRAINDLAFGFNANHEGNLKALDSYIKILRNEFNVAPRTTLSEYGPKHPKFDRGQDETGYWISINDRKIYIFSEKDPTKLPWGSLGIETVLEATGRFTAKKEAALHLQAGAKRVIISAPFKGEEKVRTIVAGVNENMLTKEDDICSGASCTTGALAPVVLAIQETIGIKDGSTPTIHSRTNDTANLQIFRPDAPARGLASPENIVLTSTGAAEAIGEVIPSLKGKLRGMAYRVPTPNGSFINIELNLKRVATIDEIKEIFRNYAQKLKFGVMAIDENIDGSIDFLGRRESSIVIFSRLSLSPSGESLTVVAAYDNEVGYVHRLIDLMSFQAEQHRAELRAGKKIRTQIRKPKNITKTRLQRLLKSSLPLDWEGHVVLAVVLSGKYPQLKWEMYPNVNPRQITITIQIPDMSVQTFSALDRYSQDAVQAAQYLDRFGKFFIHEAGLLGFEYDASGVYPRNKQFGRSSQWWEVKLELIRRAELRNPGNNKDNMNRSAVLSSSETLRAELRNQTLGLVDLLTAMDTRLERTLASIEPVFQRLNEKRGALTVISRIKSGLALRELLDPEKLRAASQNLRNQSRRLSGISSARRNISGPDQAQLTVAIQDISRTSQQLGYLADRFQEGASEITFNPGDTIFGLYTSETGEAKEVRSELHSQLPINKVAESTVRTLIDSTSTMSQSSSKSELRLEASDRAAEIIKALKHGTSEKQLLALKYISDFFDVRQTRSRLAEFERQYGIRSTGVDETVMTSIPVIGLVQLRTADGKPMIGAAAGADETKLEEVKQALDAEAGRLERLLYPLVALVTGLNHVNVLAEGTRDDIPINAQLPTGHQAIVKLGGPTIETGNDAVDGTTRTAQGKNGGISVYAHTFNGGFVPLPDDVRVNNVIYVGNDAKIDIKNDSENPQVLWEKIVNANGGNPADYTLLILEAGSKRPHHLAMIQTAKDFGLNVVEYPDGTVQTSLLAAALPRILDGQKIIVAGRVGASEAALVTAALRGIHHPESSGLGKVQFTAEIISSNSSYEVEPEPAGSIEGIPFYQPRKEGGKSVKSKGMGESRYRFNQKEVRALLQNGFTVEQIKAMQKGEFPRSLNDLAKAPATVLFSPITNLMPNKNEDSFLRWSLDENLNPKGVRIHDGRIEVDTVEVGPEGVQLTQSNYANVPADQLVQQFRDQIVLGNALITTLRESKEPAIRIKIRQVAKFISGRSFSKDLDEFIERNVAQTVVGGRSELREAFDQLDSSRALAGKAELARAIRNAQRRPVQPVNLVQLKSELGKGVVISNGIQSLADADATTVEVFAPRLSAAIIDAGRELVAALKGIGRRSIVLFPSRAELRAFQAIAGKLPANVIALDASDIETVKSELRAMHATAIEAIGLSSSTDPGYIARLANELNLFARFRAVRSVKEFFSLLGELAQRITTDVAGALMRAVAA